MKTSTPWPKAWKETQFNQISFQPHYGSTIDEDADVIGKWLTMQRDARVLVHPGWSRTAIRRTPGTHRPIQFSNCIATRAI